ncbi:tyrosine-type recombinase/integrase [Delftia tsuruhatensis]|uniref:tyrosine-type recombinase/integrase n=1 Tax=Delftia tsuruhatensis TaxID=180282 RepID=UPI002AD4C285|nr:tyrosine-type recombinase/integrase [Delftia tsuruhatensis]WQM86008.1 tyrosine-type recombinase/integrase [Delftia tsuruhatensis]
MDRKDPWMHQGEPSRFHEGWDSRFEDFLTDLFLTEGLPDSTRRTLQVEVCAYNKWSIEATGRTWDALSGSDLQSYLQAAKASVAASTFRKKQWCLRRLYAWALSESIVDENIDPYLLPVRVFSRPQPSVPTASQIQGVLEQPDVKTPEGVRDRAALELLYGAGLRAAELLGLPQDMYLQGRCLQIMGKGMKERLVVLGEPALDWIAQYKRVRTDILRAGGYAARSTRRFFVSSGHYPNYQYRQLLRMVRRYSAMCGLDLTPHSFRHAFATHLYQGRAPLDTIKLLLGHAHLETTAIYVSRHGLDDHELHRRHHPRGAAYKPFLRFGNAPQQG